MPPLPPPPQQRKRGRPPKSNKRKPGFADYNEKRKREAAEAKSSKIQLTAVEDNTGFMKKGADGLVFPPATAQADPGKKNIGVQVGQLSFLRCLAVSQAATSDEPSPRKCR